VLHVNIGKRKPAHWSLFCGESLAGFDALSVVEPYIYEDLDTGEPAFAVERNWQLFKPSTKQAGEARYAYRAAFFFIFIFFNHTAFKLYSLWHVAIFSTTSMTSKCAPASIFYCTILLAIPTPPSRHSFWAQCPPTFRSLLYCISYFMPRHCPPPPPPPHPHSG
jgi:hypothetical protein